jgi:hypothetical protein
VARGTQHRKRRPPADAGVAPAPKRNQPRHDAWEDELFFSRLRNHAKWVFVLLALVFGVGFVVFGIGSNTGDGGLSDVFPSIFSSDSGPDVSSLQDKVAEQPRNALAWRELASGLGQDDDRLDEAIVAMTRYTELKPKDEVGLQELAGLYLRRADQHANVYLVAQARSGSLAPSEPFAPPAASPLGAIFQDPLSTAVTDLSRTELTTSYAQYLDAQGKAVDAYERVVALRPDDATNQFRLGSLAEDAGKTQVAIKAYTKFLSLAPNDSQAPAAREALAALTASPAATVGGG